MKTKKKIKYHKAKIKTDIRFKEISSIEIERINNLLEPAEKKSIKNILIDNNSNEDFFKLGLNVNGKIVGYVRIKKISKDIGQMIFAMLSSYRGNGFARMLAKKAIKMAPIINIKKIIYIANHSKTKNMVNEISPSFKKVSNKKYELNFHIN